MQKQKLQKKQIKLVCKTIETLNVDISSLAINYEYDKRRNNIPIEAFIDSFWAGQDDVIYYCDNAEENKRKIIEEIQKYIEENKQTIREEVKKIDSILKEMDILDD